MIARITQSTIHFGAPFSLSGVNRILPPGDYTLAEDDELIDGLPWLAYRRVAAFLYLPDVSSNDKPARPIPVDYSELETARRQDQQKASLREKFY
jgi:hypothetical protein